MQIFVNTYIIDDVNEYYVKKKKHLYNCIQPSRLYCV